MNNIDVEDLVKKIAADKYIIVTGDSRQISNEEPAEFVKLFRREVNHAKVVKGSLYMFLNKTKED